ncbi:MAG: hypothetical protein ACPG7U_05330 [Holosporaceae bacterium]
MTKVIIGLILLKNFLNLRMVENALRAPKRKQTTKEKEEQSPQIPNIFAMTINMTRRTLQTS